MSSSKPQIDMRFRYIKHYDYITCEQESYRINLSTAPPRVSVDTFIPPRMRIISDQ